MRITSVAIKDKAGVLYTLSPPARHKDVMEAIGIKHPVTKGTVLGFMADDGKFYNRKEAFAIAVKAGQTTKTIRKEYKESLYSEDLW